MPVLKLLQDLSFWGNGVWRFDIRALSGDLITRGAVIGALVAGCRVSAGMASRVASVRIAVFVVVSWCGSGAARVLGHVSCPLASVPAIPTILFALSISPC